MSRDDVFPRSLGWPPVHAFTWPCDPPVPSRRTRRLAAGTPASKLCSPRESVRLRPHALARAKSPRRCSPGHFPSRACSIHDSGFGLSRRPASSGFEPRLRLPREPSHLASIARPGFRRLGSRTQDLPARCGRSNPRATVRQRPSLKPRSRRFSTPVACLTPREGSEAPCLRPLSAAPRASRALHDRNPQGVPTAGPRRRLCETVLVDRSLARPIISWGFVPSRVGS